MQKLSARPHGGMSRLIGIFALAKIDDHAVRLSSAPRA
jgi:hypothetical protein